MPIVVGALVLGWVLVAGCSSVHYKKQADVVAYDIIIEKQGQAFGETEPFWIERPEDTLRRRFLLDQNLPYKADASLGADAVTPIEYWPKELDVGHVVRSDPTAALADNRHVKLSLMNSLRAAAYNSRDYQSFKEQVFRTALTLDLERHAFEMTWGGVLRGGYISDLRSDSSTSGLEGGASLSMAQRLKNGMTLTAQIGIDLAKLLAPGDESSSSLFGDFSVEVPLLRGVGKNIVVEALTQAERDVLYAIYAFERFKRTFAVAVASDYFNVLQQLDAADNAANNYRRLTSLSRQSRSLGTAGRLAENQVGEAVQRKLSARDNWIASLQRHRQALDEFKISLGLPPDARLELDTRDMELLGTSVGAFLRMEREEFANKTVRELELPSEAPTELMPPDHGGGGPFEIDEQLALDLAIEKRLDLRVASGRVFDAQRGVVVAANALRAELTLLGTANVGGRRGILIADEKNILDLILDEGRYDALLTLDVPMERTGERNQFRDSLIAFQEAARNLQAVEDRVKLEVRNDQRNLLQTRESLRIQTRAVALAERRVSGTRMLLDAGRIDVRDVLDAEDSLVSAQDALTRAMVGYRVSELSFQRDVALLDVNEEGMWKEFNPELFEE